MHSTRDSGVALTAQLEQLLLELPTSLRGAGMAGQRCLHGTLQDMETVLGGLHRELLQGVPAARAERDRLRTMLQQTRRRMAQSLEILAHLQRWVDERQADAAHGQNYDRAAGTGAGHPVSYGRRGGMTGTLHGGLEAEG